MTIAKCKFAFIKRVHKKIIKTVSNNIANALCDRCYSGHNKDYWGEIRLHYKLKRKFKTKFNDLMKLNVKIISIKII